jgi:hemerythrin
MDSYRIEWSPTLSVGDERIDEQHRVLIEMIVGIPDTASPGDALLLQAAVAYSAQHFAAEEEWLRAAGYPEAEAHRREHRRLSTILATYRREYAAGKSDLYAFKQFMFRWIRDHVMDADREFGEWLRQSAPAPRA